MTPRRALLPLFALPLAADDGAATFAIHCAACHAPDYGLVGPSLVEIASLYKEDPAGFVKWTLAPGKKRENMIEMPSMAHLGEPALREIHAYVLSAAAGKTEKKPPTGAEGDPFPDDGRRPKVQRMFLPDASPAAIAVALPGDLSFCFDAGECRLRYVWKGGFLDGWPYWKGNGSSIAKLGGKVVYREKTPLFGASGGSAGPEFLGYELKDGIPTFRYRRDGAIFAERITALPDGSGIVREITTDSAAEIRWTDTPDAEVGRTGGPEKFILTLRWKP